MSNHGIGFLWESALLLLCHASLCQVTEARSPLQPPATPEHEAGTGRQTLPCAHCPDTAPCRLLPLRAGTPPAQCQRVPVPAGTCEEGGRGQGDQQHRSTASAEVAAGRCRPLWGNRINSGPALSSVTSWGMGDTAALTGTATGTGGQECALRALGFAVAGSGLPVPRLPALALQEQREAQQEAYLWAGSRETLC